MPVKKIEMTLHPKCKVSELSEEEEKGVLSLLCTLHNMFCMVCTFICIIQGKVGHDLSRRLGW